MRGQGANPKSWNEHENKKKKKKEEGKKSRERKNCARPKNRTKGGLGAKEWGIRGWEFGVADGVALWSALCGSDWAEKCVIRTHRGGARPLGHAQALFGALLIMRRQTATPPEETRAKGKRPGMRGREKCGWRGKKPNPTSPHSVASSISTFGILWSPLTWQCRETKELQGIPYKENINGEGKYT